MISAAVARVIAEVVAEIIADVMIENQENQEKKTNFSKSFKL
jgi:hypothetical protein